MPQIFKNVPPADYRPRWKDLDKYTRVAPAEVPARLTWLPTAGRMKGVVVLASLGDLYRLIRYLDTGEVAYYRRTDMHADPISPPEKLDVEPKRPRRPQMRVGALCWYVVDAAWFLVEITDRHKNNITLRPVTGWDADRMLSWRFPDTIVVGVNSVNGQRIRKLAERYV